MKNTCLVVTAVWATTLCTGCISLFQPPASDTGAQTDNAPLFDPELFFCGLTNCTRQLVQCMLDPECFEALLCHARCGSDGAREDQQACHLSCQLSYNRSAAYRAMIQCFAVNGCLPTQPAGTDGQCPVTAETIDMVVVLESLDELAGSWREVRGRNCGVPGSNWEGGYDTLPCRASSWVLRDQWWYHTSFCAPTAETCNETEIVHLIAEPRLSETQPGLIEVPYANPTLQPQDEQWYVLSRPHPDWVMYTYCGSTPVGTYAGVNIMTQATEASDDAMPAEVEAAFRQTAMLFGIDYDDMCVTDHSTCPPILAEQDVQAWVDGL